MAFRPRVLTPRGSCPRRSLRRAVWPGLLLLLAAGAATAQIEIAASPDVDANLSGVPVRDRQVAIDDLMGSMLVENFGGLPDGVDVDGFDPEVGRPVRFSVDVTVLLPGGTVANPDDVVRMDAGVFTIDFDGAAHGVPDGVNLDAVARLPGGELLISFDVPVELGGVRADDEDVLRFDGTSFSLYFDASVDGIDPDLDLDGVVYAGEGRIGVSFDGSGSYRGVDFQDEDVITLKPAGGNPKLFFDASMVHPGWEPSDLDAVAIPEPGAKAGLAAGMALLAALARRRRTRSQLVTMLLLAAAPSHAVDGVREMNQTCAESTGCFTGDTPGFPITITAAGSYRLTGNLALPDANTHGILVSADGVSVDLNGFQISGVTLCGSLPPISCSGTGSGRGVTASGTSVKGLLVRGGMLRGMGDDGVFVGNHGRVEDVRALGNGGDGIEAASSGHVLRCTASDNGGRGIVVQSNGIVADNTVFSTGAGQIGISTGNSMIVRGNRVTGASGDGITAGSTSIVSGNSVASSGGDGIEVSFGVRVEGNTVAQSTGFALRFTSADSGYAGNVFTLNGGNVTGSATNLGGNLCAGVLCP